MKWTSAATAPNQLTAEIWCDLLQEQGIPAVIEPRDAVSFLGISSRPCRVMVPEDRVEEARAMLADLSEEAGDSEGSEDDEVSSDS